MTDHDLFFVKIMTATFNFQDTKMKATLDKIENVEKVISGSKSDKQKNIAKKTKAMLLRGKSIGNDDIPPEDRIYISCFFSSNSTTKCFFFSKHATVGNSLQYIGDSQTLLAYGTPTRPAGMTLCFTTLGDDCSPCGWNYSSLLSTYIDEDFYELGIAVIDIKDHIDAQNMIIAEQQNQVKSGEKEDYKVVACQPYKKGEKVIYKNTEVGVIIGVHSEDDPPYYTIQLSGEGGSLKEKQTVGDNLSIFTEPVGSQETLPTAQSAGECFAIRLSSGGKVKRIENIPVDGTVGDLKRVISKYTGVLPARQKLLYKGKVLKIDSAKLRTDGVAERKKDVVLEDNSLVILMTMTK